MKNRFMSKSVINLMIDGLLFLLLFAMAGLGLLIKYVLLSGYQTNEIYGGNVELLFWGLDRHQWGTIHLWVSLVFVFFIFLHVILHWTMIVCIAKKIIAGSGTRLVVSFSLAFLAIILGIGPLFIEPEVGSFEVRHLNRRDVVVNNSESQIDEISGVFSAETNELKDDQQEEQTHDDLFDSLEISGSMTLSGVAEQYQVSVNELADALNVSRSESNETLGRLRKKYGFRISRVKEEVIKLQ